MEKTPAEIQPHYVFFASFYKEEQEVSLASSSKICA
jgi:hypothetical protein